MIKLFYSCMTCACIKKKKKKNQDILISLAVDPEATPLQKPLVQRDGSERQDFPGQEHFFCPPFAFPAWPADSYPVREVCCPLETLPGGALQHRAAGS